MTKLNDTLYYIRIDNTTKNHKLHKFATVNNKFGKINYYRHASWYIVHIYQFSTSSDG